ncbi:ABC transporter permease [uncultured Flavonifractor sp.]|uniref:ABC transporter permease n=1 Tax=uncultured Flavonifractor sp. TaxID=1193534 RepID=UPI002602D0B2|nr:ABC transporter permease [uncultured Flavonifractor sp.]
MIWRNFFRDLRRTASRLISVSIITMIAVVVYTGLSGIIYNVDRIMGSYYQAQNVAGYWITGVGLDMGDCRALEGLEGVTGVQPRVVLDAEERHDSGITLSLYGVPEAWEINIPYVTAGRLPEGNREIFLSDQFAQARGLEVGDWYEITLTGLGVHLRLQVCGLGKNPECLYPINATTPSPDLSRYGFAYVKEEALQDILGPHIYNQICITAADGVPTAQIRAAVDGVLGSKVVNILTLADNQQAYALMEAKNNLTPILTFFPTLFFLCAVLMMVSTMNRLIESARTDIGTFKALGYSDGTILRYYLLHALLVVVFGFPIGAVLGRPIAALIVWTIATGCDLPAAPIVHDFAAWGQALGLTALCCLGSAWLVARSLLKETPAQCMRPKAPKGGSSLLLEHVRPLWRRLGFNQKYILRNTFRNKVRLLTCVVGIAFCMALVFMAFAIKDSMDAYSNTMARNQNSYDLMVDLNTAVTESQYSRLASSPGVTGAELEMTTTCWLYSPGQRATTTLTVAEDVVSLHLYDPYAAAPLALPEEGLVLEKLLADELGLEEGDSVTLRFTGESGYVTLTVAEVNRCVSGAYVSRSLWRSLGRAYTPTAAYLTAGDTLLLEQQLDGYDFVDGWQSRQSVTAAVVEKMENTSMVVYILIVFGGGLACIVIYNLGIMSFFEQIRSLATLMVLGFYQREIKRLQLSENLIFAAVGIVLGIPLGIGLDRFLILSITAMPLEVVVTPRAIALSCGVTMAFALAVNAVIGRKMREIDMLGALKSIE